MRRHSAGAPAGTGGQFAPEHRPATDIDLTPPAPVDLNALWADFGASQRAYRAASDASNAAAAKVLVAMVRGRYPNAKYLTVTEADDSNRLTASSVGPLDADGKALTDDEFWDDDINDVVGWSKDRDIDPYIENGRLDLDALLAAHS